MADPPQLRLDPTSCCPYGHRFLLRSVSAPVARRDVGRGQRGYLPWSKLRSWPRTHYWFMKSYTGRRIRTDTNICILSQISLSIQRPSEGSNNKYTCASTLRLSYHLCAKLRPHAPRIHHLCSPIDQVSYSSLHHPW